MEIINKAGNIHTKIGYIEYEMSENMARNLLDNRKSGDSKMNPNEYLCKVVNDNFGLKGNCVKVIVI